MQNRQLATWLTQDKYESFGSDWESQQQVGEELKDKPDDLKRYEEKLKQPLLTTTKLNVFAREVIKINRLNSAI